MKAFGEKNLQPDIFCVCDDPRDAMLWVQEGLATAVFPRSMEDLCTDLPIRIIEEEKLKTRILLAWKKDRRPSAVMQEFINICEEYKEISPVFEQDIYEAISMKTCVEKRITLGAPGPDVMEKVIAGNKKYLEEN